MGILYTQAPFEAVELLPSHTQLSKNWSKDDCLVMKTRYAKSSDIVLVIPYIGFIFNNINLFYTLVFKLTHFVKTLSDLVNQMLVVVSQY